jgi:hypothetical protein
VVGIKRSCRVAFAYTLWYVDAEFTVDVGLVTPDDDAFKLYVDAHANLVKL